MPIFNDNTLRLTLSTFPQAQRWWIAYSGGMDSHCLLHALATLASELPQLRAIHVNHGLNPASQTWARHCELVCHQLTIPYYLLTVTVPRSSAQGLEAAARTARYQAFAQLIDQNDLLLTAHHLDDQAETLLLQLLRGSGARGLAAMPLLTKFKHGYLARPLLKHSRAELLEYAQNQGLNWIDDDSNLNQHYDRNYLRHQIFPLLRQRWPSAAVTLARAAAHQAQTVALLETLATQDLAKITQPQPNILPISALIELNKERARNLLRFWMRSNGHQLPSTAILERILDEALTARWDANTLINWDNSELRRYRNLLYLLTPLPPLPLANWTTEWTDLSLPLILPWGQLKAEPSTALGLDATACQRGVNISLRHGGERCRLPNAAYHRHLKDLWQAAGVPPWERIRTPLLWINNQLAAVPGIGICHNFCKESGLKIIWYPN